MGGYEKGVLLLLKFDNWEREALGVGIRPIGKEELASGVVALADAEVVLPSPAPAPVTVSEPPPPPRIAEDARPAVTGVGEEGLRACRCCPLAANVE